MGKREGAAKEIASGTRKTRESIGQLIKIMRGKSRHGGTSRQRRKGVGEGGRKGEEW